MNSERIKEIQETTAYPNSVSVQQALLQVWSECEQDKTLQSKGKTKEEVRNEYYKLVRGMNAGDPEWSQMNSTDIFDWFWNNLIESHANKDDNLLNQPNDIDVIGNCANCGVEYHIHKSHANKDGDVTKEDFVNELDKHFKNRPDLNKEFDRIDSLIASIRLCTRPIQGHNDPKSINDCFEELEYYSKLLRSRTTLPPKPQI